MYVVNKCGRDYHRLRTARRIKTLIAAPESKHLGHSIGMVEFKE
jgi:hypothetical protein